MTQPASPEQVILRSSAVVQRSETWRKSMDWLTSRNDRRWIGCPRFLIRIHSAMLRRDISNFLRGPDEDPTFDIHRIINEIR